MDLGCAYLVVVPSALIPELRAEQTIARRLCLTSSQMMLATSLGNLPMEVPPYFWTTQSFAQSEAPLTDSISQPYRQLGFVSKERKGERQWPM